MKKIMVLFLFAAISFFTSQSIQAQSIDLGIGGGLTLVQTPASYTDAGFSTEYHIGIKGKLNFPLVPITPIGFIEYHFLSGTETINTLSVDTKQNILSIGVGGEFSLVPGPISPYIGLDFEYNNFGDFKRSGAVDTTLKSSNSRTGIGVGAGVMIKLIPLFNVDVSLKYQMLNLFGKENNEDTIGIINLNAAIFF